MNAPLIFNIIGAVFVLIGAASQWPSESKSVKTPEPKLFHYIDSRNPKEKYDYMLTNDQGKFSGRGSVMKMVGGRWRIDFITLDEVGAMRKWAEALESAQKDADRRARNELRR